MKKNVISLVLAIAAGVLMTSCEQGPTYKVIKLPSGRDVKIVGVMRMAFSGGDSALMLRYFTDATMTNTMALQDEAEDIWKKFRVDVEKAGLKDAILSANTMPHGIISQTRGFNFVFKRQPTGEWLLTNDLKEKTSNPTSEGIRQPADGSPVKR